MGKNDVYWKQLKDAYIKGNYELAAALCKKIDWSREKDPLAFNWAIEACERAGDFETAYNIVLAECKNEFNWIHEGDWLTLIMLAIQLKKLSEAREFLKKYEDKYECDIRYQVVYYELRKAEGAGDDELIDILEKAYDPTELAASYMYKLAVLYSRTGRKKECVKICDDIAVLSGDSKYEAKASLLKRYNDYPKGVSNEKKVVLAEKYTWVIVFHDGVLSFRCSTKLTCSEDEIVKVKVTEDMLSEMQELYCDVVAACFPQFKKEDICFYNIEKLIDTEVCADELRYGKEYVNLYTNLEDEIFEDYYMMIDNPVRMENGCDFAASIYINHYRLDCFDLEELEIDEQILTSAIKKFVVYAAPGKLVNVADKLEKIKADRGAKYCLEYSIVKKPAHAETVKSEPIKSETKDNSAKTKKSVYMSVASADFTRVTPILNKIREKGYSVLCNMDIVEHGSTSKTKIMMSETLYMDACDFYLIFISNEYINNYPHIDEMNYMLGLKKKKCIPVYLESVELPLDMMLFIGSNKNAVRKYEYDNEQDFYNELFGGDRFVPKISEQKTDKPVPIRAADKKIIEADDYRCVIEINTKYVNWEFIDLKPHLENETVKVKITKSMYEELEDCYRDIMLACYPELSRDDVSFADVAGHSKSFINSELSEGESIRLATSLITRKFKYTVSIIRKKSKDNLIEVYAFDENKRQISVDSTSIDKSALVEPLNRLINIMDKPTHAETKEEPAKPEKLVYLSLASADFMRVMPIANEIHKRGYRVIWDFFMVAEGTTADSVLNEKESIGTSEFYVVFISDDYINSYPHMDEMDYAIGKEGKKCIPVYLENVELPYDMKQFIGTNENAVRKYGYDNEQDFYNELFGEGRIVPLASE